MPLVGYLQGAIPPQIIILVGRKETIMDVNSITENKASRVTEIQIGEKLFTVVSVESDRAKERLYDKVKRLILDNADRSQAA